MYSILSPSELSQKFEFVFCCDFYYNSPQTMHSVIQQMIGNYLRTDCWVFKPYTNTYRISYMCVCTFSATLSLELFSKQHWPPRTWCWVPSNNGSPCVWRWRLSRFSIYAIPPSHTHIHNKRMWLFATKEHSAVSLS